MTAVTVLAPPCALEGIVVDVTKASHQQRAEFDVNPNLNLSLHES